MDGKDRKSWRAREATRDLCWRRLRCSRNPLKRLLPLFFQLFFGEGGVHEHVGHDLEQGSRCVAPGSGHSCQIRKFRSWHLRGPPLHRFRPWFGLAVPARMSDPGHGGVASAGALEDGIHVQGQAVADPGEFVVFDHDQA